MRPARMILVSLILLAAACAEGGVSSALAVARDVTDPRLLAGPGPLDFWHRADGGGDIARHDCMACHALTEATPDGKCLDCHALVGERIAGALGYHGRDLAGACGSCHADHGPELVQFDADAFDHDLALYPLERVHAATSCADCHEVHARGTSRMQYLGLAFDTCSDCHAEVDGQLAGGLVVGGAPLAAPPSPHAGKVHCVECHDTAADPDSREAYAVLCAKCHTPRYGLLYLDRAVRLDTLEARIRATVSPDEAPAIEAQLLDLRRIGSHNFVPVEARLTEMAGPSDR